MHDKGAAVMSEEYMEKNPIQVADRLFGAVELLADRGELGLMEIAQALGLNKTTAFRILRSLIYMGYVTQNEENGKYSLTLKLASLGHKVVLRTDIIVVVHPFLARLSEETGETVHFVKRDGADAVYIDKVMGKAHSAEMGSRIGGRIPLYCSGVGKAICAALSLDETAVVWQESDVRRITPYTITNYEDFMFSLEDVRKRGYALDNEENESGVRCIAATVIPAGGSAQYAFSISAPVERMDNDRIHTLAEFVLRTKGESQRAIG